MMKVGIIGTGAHGSRYARHIVNDLPVLRLTAISRRGEEGKKQAAEWRSRDCCHVYSSRFAAHRGADPAV